MNFSVQNKQNKKNTFFGNLKFWLFHDYLKLDFFPEENPIQNLQILWGRVEIVKKIKGVHRFALFDKNSQNFETEHKLTVSLLVCNISKFWAIP